MCGLPVSPPPHTIRCCHVRFRLHQQPCLSITTVRASVSEAPILPGSNMHVMNVEPRPQLYCGERYKRPSHPPPLNTR